MKTTFSYAMGLFVTAIVFCCLASCGSLANSDSLPTEAWRMPIDVTDEGSYEAWIEFGWKSFLAVNWPAHNDWPVKAQFGGRPKKDLPITNPTAASLPTVWQTYLEPGQVFLENGEDPGTWDQPKKLVVTKNQLPVLGGFGELGLSLALEPEIGLALFDLAVTPNPLVDQNGNYVLIETRMNQTEFQYFKETKYYDAYNQQKVFEAETPNFVYMPQTGNESLPDWTRQGALEIKASWKILEERKDIASRYFTTKGYYRKPDGTHSGPHTFGLVGLHIMRNTPKSYTTWFWTTFEHVDNVRIQENPVPIRPDGKPLTPSFNEDSEPQYAFGFDLTDRFEYARLKEPNFNFNPVTEPKTLSNGDVIPRTPPDKPVNCSRVTPISPEVQEANVKYQQILQGTVWRYYEMIDVLYPMTSGGMSPVPDIRGNPQDDVYVNTPALINITLETYLTYKPATWEIDNCLSCHNNARPRGSKKVLDNPSFKITEQSLKDLKSEKVPDDVLEKLKSIKNQEISGERKFLDTLIATIGADSTVYYQSLILKHAATKSKVPQVFSYMYRRAKTKASR